MNEFASLLRIVDSWQYIWMKPILYPEVSLEMSIEELVKLILKRFCCPTLRKREIFIVCKLAEIFAKNVLKVI